MHPTLSHLTNINSGSGVLIISLPMILKRALWGFVDLQRIDAFFFDIQLEVAALSAEVFG